MEEEKEQKEMDLKEYTTLLNQFLDYLWNRIKTMQDKPTVYAACVKEYGRILTELCLTKGKKINPLARPEGLDIKAAKKKLGIHIPSLKKPDDKEE